MNKKLKEGDLIKPVFPGREPDLLLQITNAGYKQFKYLDDEDAEREGYNSLGELKKDLLSIYPLLDSLTRLYYYQFRVVDEDGNESKSP